MRQWERRLIHAVYQYLNTLPVPQVGAAPTSAAAAGKAHAYVQLTRKPAQEILEAILFEDKEGAEAAGEALREVVEKANRYLHREEPKAGAA